MELEALFNAVIVKPIEAEETLMVILLFLIWEKKKMNTLVSYQLGPGQYTIHGDFITTI